MSMCMLYLSLWRATFIVGAHNINVILFVEHEQTIATFFGAEYLHYNFTGKGEAVVSNVEIIRLSFKTTSGEGLLFYTGKY